MNFPLIANIVVFVVLLFALAQTRHKQWSLAKKVLVGLVTVSYTHLDEVVISQ